MTLLADSAGPRVIPRSSLYRPVKLRVVTTYKYGKTTIQIFDNLQVLMGIGIGIVGFNVPIDTL